MPVNALRERSKKHEATDMVCFGSLQQLSESQWAVAIRSKSSLGGDEGASRKIFVVCLATTLVPLTLFADEMRLIVECKG